MSDKTIVEAGGHLTSHEDSLIRFDPTRAIAYFLARSLVSIIRERVVAPRHALHAQVLQESGNPTLADRARHGATKGLLHALEDEAAVITVGSALYEATRLAVQAYVRRTSGGDYSDILEEPESAVVPQVLEEAE